MYILGLFRERFSNIGLYDGMNWNTLNGGLKYEVISAAVDSKTNNIYVACTSENANALPLFRWSPSSGVLLTHRLSSSIYQLVLFIIT